MLPRDFVDAVGQHQDQPPAGQVRADVAQQFQARRIRPVDVLQHDEQRPRRLRPRAEGAHLIEEFQLARQRADLVRGQERRQGGQAAVLSIAGRKVEPQTVGWRGRQVEAVPHGNRHTQRTGGLHRVAGERRLPDPRLTADEDHSPTPVPCGGKLFVQQGTLRPPPDECRT